MMGIALMVSYTLPGSSFSGEFDMVDIDSNFGCAAGVSRVELLRRVERQKQKKEKEKGKKIKITKFHRGNRLTVS